MNYHSIEMAQFRRYRNAFKSTYKINDMYFNRNLLKNLYSYSHLVVMNTTLGLSLMVPTPTKWNDVGIPIEGMCRHIDRRLDATEYIFTESNSVVISALEDNISIYAYIQNDVRIICDIIKIKHNALKLSNVKGVIEATASTGRTMKRVLDETLDIKGSYVVTWDKNNIMDEIKIQQLHNEYEPQKHIEDYNFQNGVILTMLGIPMNTNPKRERLLTGEIASANFETDNIREEYIQFMQEQLDKVNTMFNTSLTFEERVPLQLTQGTEEQQNEELQ